MLNGVVFVTITNACRASSGASVFPWCGMARDMVEPDVKRVGRTERNSEEDRSMNPADVAQSALPVTADLSIFGLFLQAHWVVKLVMIGPARLLDQALGDTPSTNSSCSPAPKKRADGPFIAGILVRPVAGVSFIARCPHPRPHWLAALFVAPMRHWKRGFEGHAKVLLPAFRPKSTRRVDVTIHLREIDRLERLLLVLATVGSTGPLRRAVRHRLGIHEQLPVDRRLEEYTRLR